jgi:hypothetical protein
MKARHTGDAAAGDAIDLIYGATRDNREPAFHCLCNIAQEPIALRIWSDKMRTRHKRSERSVEIEEQRGFRERQKDRFFSQQDQSAPWSAPTRGAGQESEARQIRFSNANHDEHGPSALSINPLMRAEASP